MATIFSRVAYTVANVTSPGGKDRGRQFRAALPNDAGRTPTGEKVTSFAAPYLVYWGVVTKEEDIMYHVGRLNDQGFSI